MVSKRSIAAVGAVGVIGITAGGVAYADSASHTSAKSGTSATAAQHVKQHGKSHNRHNARRFGRRLLHAQLVLRSKQGPRTVDLQRGVVTAVSPTSVTVKSTDDASFTYTVNDQTKVRDRRKASSISAVHDGQRVFVGAIESAGGDRTARRIRILPAKPAAAKSGAKQSGSATTSG